MISLLAALSLVPQGQPITITVEANKILHPISPDLFGIFFEEINCAGDGGIYPELVRNRSFEDSDKPEHWDVSSGLDATVEKGKLVVNASSEGEIENKGYWGMSLKKGQKYLLQVTGDFPDASQLTFEATDGSRPVASSVVKFAKGDDRTAVATIVPSESTAAGALKIKVAKGQKFALDYVSLFPTATFKGRTNGLRPGLMTMLNDLGPAFVRFPGGCWVEGDRMASAYRWKTTINNLETRRTVPNLWGYKSTNGLGYHEYLQMCEDLGAAPLFVVNCGMSHKETVPLGQMDEFVQDAVDAIEYANGPVTSKWGAVRAKNGHPKPFNLKYVEIGNENGGPAYNERYKLIFDAIKSKYPNIMTVADVWGGTPTSAPTEIIDEHYYNNPAFFFQNAHRYDTYDRKGPQIYVGEYAVTQGCGSGNVIGAIAEAAFMTGMERNSDVVRMASYAPLFANVNAKAWNPDLIYFDSSNVYGTPSYYVQKLFARNRATDVVESSVTSIPETKSSFPVGGIGVGTWDTQSEYKDITIIEDGKETKITDPKSMMKPATGKWEFDGDTVRQTSDEEGAKCMFPMPKSASYTLKLKAKKNGGREGFLVLVGAKDADNFMWLNLGGWTNTVHGLELGIDGGKSQVGHHMNGTIETGRWYDIQIDYSPEKMVCYLDGKMIFDEKPISTPRFFYSAGIDKAKKELVLKVVQGAAQGQDVAIDIKGVAAGSMAKGFVISSQDPAAENSLEDPKKVVPVPIMAKVEGGTLRFKAEPYSLTILRLPIK
ncbi:MAG: alpha-L-arabinofuranosidase [Armatimonadetes bacterium]|nr:alpha-L-arabinofuranosidase [Armatimonadota bacterium]